MKLFKKFLKYCTAIHEHHDSENNERQTENQQAVICNFVVHENIKHTEIQITRSCRHFTAEVTGS